MLLLIDNYDSFTWNLVHCIGVIDPSLEIRVVRHDDVAAAEVLEGGLPDLDQIEALARARDEALARLILTLRRSGSGDAS